MLPSLLVRGSIVFVPAILREVDKEIRRDLLTLSAAFHLDRIVH